MLIEFKKLIPDPLPVKVVEESEIWANFIKLEPESQVIIRAQSGMGKSTLLHIIYGIRKDYSGQLLIDGKSIREQNLNQETLLRRKLISIVFQDLRLFPHLTARQNLEIIPEENPSAPSLEQMTERLGVEACLDQSVSTLSHGQRQRIALIRALRKPFRWLLLDEPFSHLDIQNQTKASELIQETTLANKAGVLLSSLGETPALSFDYSYSL